MIMPLCGHHRHGNKSRFRQAWAGPREAVLGEADPEEVEGSCFSWRVLSVV
jgi:hypothetical protein